MFYGDFDHTIDGKGRLILPSKIRDTLDKHSITSLMITRGLDQCLFLFPPSEWHTIEGRLRERAFTKAVVRSFTRTFFANAAECMPDSHGRILIPQKLRDYAGLEKEVTVAGVQNRIEVWARDKWIKVLTKSQANYEEVAEQVWD